MDLNTSDRCTELGTPRGQPRLSPNRFSLRVPPANPGSPQTSLVCESRQLTQALPRPTQSASPASCQRKPLHPVSVTDTREKGKGDWLGRSTRRRSNAGPRYQRPRDRAKPYEGNPGSPQTGSVCESRQLPTQSSRSISATGTREKVR